VAPWLTTPAAQARPPWRLEDALHGRQADAGAGELVGRVEPLEDTEQLAAQAMPKPTPLSRTKNAGSGVAVNPNSMRASGRRLVNFHALPSRLSSTTRKQALVAFDPQLRRDDELHRAPRFGFPQVGGNRLSQGGEIDRLPVQFAPPNARELQQVINQVAHALAGFADAAEEVLPAGIELAGMAFEQHLAEAADAAQRRAQVV